MRSDVGRSRPSMTTSIMNFARRSAIHKQQPPPVAKGKTPLPGTRATAPMAKSTRAIWAFMPTVTSSALPLRYKRKMATGSGQLASKSPFQPSSKWDLTRKQFTALVKVVLICSHFQHGKCWAETACPCRGSRSAHAACAQCIPALSAFQNFSDRPVSNY